ncbi:hypothetical protein CVT26_001264 [Gymnopilus dilepis]|uniref:Anaphase-promoting complex subunit 4 WD40 domain-containing protein n=1 Tax=Gymnopilus dilepis TaxID=231916 RepID=A0A409WEG3_9AGAR|nr:hypothetical protein CVT26_001264 [Gymnopilus dilepis]
MTSHHQAFEFVPKTCLKEDCYEAVSCVAFSGTGLFFAVGVGNAVLLWNSNDVSSEPLVEVRSEGLEATCLVPFADGLLCGYSSGQIVFIMVDLDSLIFLDLDLTSQKCKLRGFRASKAAIHLIALRKSGSLMSAAGPGGISIWHSNKNGAQGEDWDFVKFLPQPDENLVMNGQCGSYEVTSLSWYEETTNLVVCYGDYGIIIKERGIQTLASNCASFTSMAMGSKHGFHLKFELYLLTVVEVYREQSPQTDVTSYVLQGMAFI